MLQDGGSNPPATNTKLRKMWVDTHMPQMTNLAVESANRGTRIVWGKTGEIHHTKVQNNSRYVSSSKSKVPLVSLFRCAKLLSPPSSLSLSLSLRRLVQFLSHYDEIRTSHTSCALQCNLPCFYSATIAPSSQYLFFNSHRFIKYFYAILHK